jgi:predicted ribosome quality control (RQC) complex YloA/Tae2 family protein
MTTRLARLTRSADAAGRAGPPPPPSGVLEYELPDGWRAFAGRTDAANDYVSLKLARANDRWFHVRGMPGGHVVLRVDAERAPDRATLERAAGLAAYHSKARAGGVVAVSMTEGRHVSKPRGAKAGTVEIRKESVLKVRPLTEEEVSAMRRGGSTR